jgi:hypothetical protein
MTAKAYIKAISHEIEPSYTMRISNTGRSAYQKLWGRRKASEHMRSNTEFGLPDEDSRGHPRCRGQCETENCVRGTWHHISAKHLAAYPEEMEFRFNNRQIPLSFPRYDLETNCFFKSRVHEAYSPKVPAALIGDLIPGLM